MVTCLNCSIWTDVMDELRNGIKLKKVTFSKTPSEYELTPYEMLMADIRKKVKLNPTRIPPRVKTDAKDIILDFIRSRPPLRPASSRKLAPKTDDSTPMEKLMQVWTENLFWLFKSKTGIFAGNPYCWSFKMFEEDGNQDFCTSSHQHQEDNQARREFLQRHPQLQWWRHDRSTSQSKSSALPELINPIKIVTK